VVYKLKVHIILKSNWRGRHIQRSSYFVREPNKPTNSAPVIGITVIEGKRFEQDLVRYETAESVWTSVKLSLSVIDKK